MADEKQRPKLVVKQPGRDMRIANSGTFVAAKKAVIKRVAPAKRAPAKKKG